MECSGYARRHAAQRYKQAEPRPSGMLRAAALTVSTAATLAVSPGIASADPAPPTTPAAVPAPGESVKQLKDQATRAQNEFETLTEQYDGLRVQLDQAAKAQQVADDAANRAQASYQTVHQRIGQFAASSYMHAGGEDPAMVLLSSHNPASLLDQASTLHYFATENGTQAQTLFQALQSAVRARKAAQDRASEVQTLRTLIDQKRRTLTQLYAADRDKIAKQDPTQLVDLPVISSGGSSRALQALQWALRERGRPYVWGAAGPESFDCSGLTMWAYGKVGINLPHYTGSQWNSGTHISRDQLQPGDLVFFYSDLHHMGMYVGNGMIVHAPHTGDVVRLAPLAGRPFAGAVRVA